MPRVEAAAASAESEAAEEAEARKKAGEEDAKEFTLEVLERKLREVVAVRGKRSTNLKDQIATLRKLSERGARFGAAGVIPALTQLVSAQFDTSRSLDSR